MEVKSRGFGVQLPWIRSLALPLSSWVTLGKSFDLSGLSFLSCKVGIIIMPVSQVLVRNNEIM